ncbi:Histidinol phosphatase of the PHP family protein [Anaerohalosphaera lusitana]|uniref:Histidinol phosphatase of the PHP family protein n=1 Tax=Anaerohalosphaera lusitana TaxID=1936003 RepID=A0A1U9NJN5_9BACT|nr:histidinol-phosphatase [Anaerohalosphaera lusitana]AQT67790.1 Histidinol phosphatase of the PHP family protein [Anaerohalosphaera lusitana]
MKMRMVAGLAVVLFLVGLCGAQEYFPNIEGYETLTADLHTHTVFSDGTVWPTVRIDEAKREGIDVISISDHIEYQPHKWDIPTNHNRSYEIAKPAAEKAGVLLVKGTEITRDTPPGHYNALFIEDVDPLETDEFMDVIEEANRQGGFVFWNHHAWQGEERGKWEEVQDVMYDEGWLHGMEVANAGDYYPDAHAWCMEKGLTMVGNSDIHGPSIDYEYTAQKHRTLTLVFVKKRNLEEVEKALRRGRTTVWVGNRLVGKERYLRPLFGRMVKVVGEREAAGNTRLVEVANGGLIDLELVRPGEDGPEKIVLGARSSVEFEVAEDAEEEKFTVENMLVRPGEGLEVVIGISGAAMVE